MKINFKSIFGVLSIIPFIVSIAGWLNGWEITYRPISNAPFISLYTSVVFTLFFSYKLIICEINFSEKSFTILKNILFGTICSVLLVELIVYSNQANEIAGYPISSISTILTFVLVLIFEIMSNEIEENSIIADGVILLSLFWVYISICGHFFEEAILTGMTDASEIGLSLPTALAFLLYIGILILDDTILFTKTLFTTVNWTKKYILTYLLAYLLLPFLFVILLKHVEVSQEDHAKIFVAFSIIGLLFITLFIVLIHFLSRTHIGLQMVCKYTNRIKIHDGSWISIESYLETNYGHRIKHSQSPDSQEFMSKLAQKKQ